MARYTKSGTVNTVQEINSELEKIATAQEDFLSRSGETPNEMNGTLDMNANRIINLPAPASPNDPVRAQDLPDFVGEGDSLLLVTKEESQILSAGQFVVTLADLTTTQTAFYISGISVDQGRLIANTDYVVDSTTQITLTDSYPAGTRITAVQNEGTEEVTSDIQTFDNIADMKAASLGIGDTVLCKREISGEELVEGLIFNIQASGTGEALSNGNVAVKFNSDLQTEQPVELYVATTGNDITGTGTGGNPFATVQKAVDSLPRIIANDVVINIADGVYTDVGGQDEFGRGVCVDVSKHLLSIKRDTTAPLNEKKAKLIFRGASEAGTILDGTNNATTRYVFWVHEVQGVQLENLTCRNSYGGVIVHQNADVTLRDVTTTGCDFGRMIESNSRMEVLRGSNTANTRNYFIKNGQLQENDSTISASVENNFLLDGMAWIYLLRTDLTGTASKNQIESTGAVWMEFDDCDISAGNNFVVGSYSAMRISNGCRLRDFTSAVWSNEAGYTETDGLCHIHNNAFIAFITKGAPVFNLDNADSLNASAVDEPNTNGLRIQGSATSVLIDPDVSITSADKILTRPTSGLIMKGTAPPAVTTTYYERGTMVLNEGAATGQPAFWVCTTRGFGGTAVFTAGANL